MSKNRKRHRSQRSKPARSIRTETGRHGKPTRWMPVALTLASLATLLDWGTTRFSIDEYRKCGHIHVDVVTAMFAVIFTIATCIAFREWWRTRATQ